MSLNIAVCEDDEKDAEMLYALLDIVCREWKLAAQIHRYVSAEELLAKCNTPPTAYFDIIFIDIYMDGINGIDAGRKIRRLGNCQLVFTTNSREHALEAFSLNATHYLLKPLTIETLREALNRCLPKLQEKMPALLEVKTVQGIVPIPMNHIVYIEVFRKVCMIHTEKNCFQTYTSLDALFELLDTSSFMRAQRSFVVNMSYIEAFYFDRVILKSGEEIVLSRNKRAELKNQYQKFLFHLARRGGI